MPYDANNNWIPEDDDSVATRVTGLLSQDNPLTQQARTQATQAANSRGLLNSSIAAGAGVDAVTKSVLPIASQDASQVAQKNLAQQGFQNQQSLQTQSEQSQSALQTSQQQAAAALQTQQIGATSQQQQTDLAAQQQRLDDQLSSQERQQIATLNENDRQSAASSVASANAAYAQMFEAIANNPNIPAATRDLYLQNAQSLRNSNLSLTTQLYGIQLNWGGASTVDTSAGGATPSTGTTTPPASHISGLQVG